MIGLIVIAAPSGAGKTSLIAALLKEFLNTKIKLSISFTTRKKRKDEIEGNSYFFISKKEFLLMKEKKEFLEEALVFGNLYGTGRKWVEKQIESGVQVILELDCQGAAQVKSVYPDSISIFIIPPSMKQLKKRLNKRSQDSQKIIEKRLSMARKEISKGKDFDFLVLNDDFENALNDLKQIIKKKKCINNKRNQNAKKTLLDLLNK